MRFSEGAQLGAAAVDIAATCLSIARRTRRGGKKKKNEAYLTTITESDVDRMRKDVNKPLTTITGLCGGPRAASA